MADSQNNFGAMSEYRSLCRNDTLPLHSWGTKQESKASLKIPTNYSGAIIFSIRHIGFGARSQRGNFDKLS